MTTATVIRASLAAGVAFASMMTAPPASAQSAYDINRLNQAMQI